MATITENLHKRKLPGKKIKVKDAADMKAMSITGYKNTEIAKKFNTTPRNVNEALSTLQEILERPEFNGFLLVERDAIEARIQNVKNNMVRRAEVIAELADKTVVEKLINPTSNTTAKQAAEISEIYTKRTANLSGMEELKDTQNDNAKIDNLIINIFSKLEGNAKSGQNQTIEGAVVNEKSERTA